MSTAVCAQIFPREWNTQVATTKETKLFGIRRNVRHPQHPDETTLIAEGTVIKGSVLFTGRMHVDGVIEGTICGEGKPTTLSLSAHARVTGEVLAPHVVVDGTIKGNISAVELLQIASNGRVDGDISCMSLEVSRGARINGKIAHQTDAPMHPGITKGT